jgi:ankyrin repeat protein
MKPDAERCAEYEKFKKIDAAFRVGDLNALRAAVDDPDSIPNGAMPLTIGPCLEYAIYHSPLPFIRTLLEIRANPNPADHAGFPPLIAALSCSRHHPGATARSDVIEIMKLLLSFGADPNQRGINDYTPLHMAVGEGNAAAVALLLEAVRIRICGPASTIVKRRWKWLVEQVLTKLLNCLPRTRNNQENLQLDDPSSV